MHIPTTPKLTPWLAPSSSIGLIVKNVIEIAKKGIVHLQLMNSGKLFYWLTALQHISTVKLLVPRNVAKYYAIKIRR